MPQTRSLTCPTCQKAELNLNPATGIYACPACGAQFYRGFAPQGTAATPPATAAYRIGGNDSDIPLSSQYETPAAPAMPPLYADTETGASVTGPVPSPTREKPEKHLSPRKERRRAAEYEKAYRRQAARQAKDEAAIAERARRLSTATKKLNMEQVVQAIQLPVTPPQEPPTAPQQAPVMQMLIRVEGQGQPSYESSPVSVPVSVVTPTPMFVPTAAPSATHTVPPTAAPTEKESTPMTAASSSPAKPGDIHRSTYDPVAVSALPRRERKTAYRRELERLRLVARSAELNAEIARRDVKQKQIAFKKLKREKGQSKRDFVLAKQQAEVEAQKAVWTVGPAVKEAERAALEYRQFKKKKV